MWWLRIRGGAEHNRSIAFRYQLTQPRCRQLLLAGACRASALIGLWLREASQASSPRYPCLGSWRLRPIASAAAFSSCFGRTDAYPGSSLLCVVVAALLAQKAAGATERHTSGAFLESPTSLWRFDGANDLSGPGASLALERRTSSSHLIRWSMIPTLVVPLALMLHALVLWRLRRETASTSRLAVA